MNRIYLDFFLRLKPILDSPNKSKLMGFISINLIGKLGLRVKTFTVIGFKCCISKPYLIIRKAL